MVVKRCLCGKEPEIKVEGNFHGGGRYKAGTYSRSWMVWCQCREYHLIVIYKESEEAAIKDWNYQVEKEEGRIGLAEKREASDDKLLFDLEHSSDNVEQALARLLRAKTAGKT